MLGDKSLDGKQYHIKGELQKSYGSHIAVFSNKLSLLEIGEQNTFIPLI
jgi:hypothetical protein